MPMLWNEFLEKAPHIPHHALLLLCPKLKKSGHFSPRTLAAVARSFCGIDVSVVPAADEESVETLAKHPDIFVVDTERATLRLEDVEALIRLGQYPASQGKRRLFVLQHCDRLNSNAANSLLKTIEEPPAPALFLLTAAREQDVLATISSRCQKIAVNLTPAEASLENKVDESESLATEDRNWIAGFLNAKGSGAAHLKLRDLAQISEGAERISKLYSSAEIMAILTKLLSEAWQSAEKANASVGKVRLLRAELKKWQEAEPFHPSTGLWLTRILTLASSSQ